MLEVGGAEMTEISLARADPCLLAESGSIDAAT
jgi:hypothetical protein